MPSPLRSLQGHVDGHSHVCVFAENEVNIALAIKPGANVVQVYGFCFDAPDGKVRIVMELCTHGSLRAHLQALSKAHVQVSGV